MLARRLLVTSVASIVGVRGLVTSISTSLSCRHQVAVTSVRSSLSKTSFMRSSPLSMTTNNEDNVEHKDLFLFDFDGVVCDSCDECTVAALRTLIKLDMIHEVNKDVISEPPPAWLMEKMREIRPGIEVGWQIPVLLAVVLEQQRRANQQDGPLAMGVDDIIANYECLVEGALLRWQKTDVNMIDAFGSVRDAWMVDDLESWLNINAFYEGVPQALSSCRGEGVVVTTKQQRFACALMRHAGVSHGDLPDDCIYGLGMYKNKSDVIVDRMVAGGYHPDKTHFFEDRWPTLEKCLKDDRLDGVRFYLCGWGYVTSAELELAQAEPRVQVLGLDDFAGIVVGSE